jgi:AcrR family transcriptional regulator
MRKALPETKEKFIDAALEELYLYGTAGFSIRNVAKSCGLSCAAPYRHFKSKNELIQEVITAVADRWRACVTSLLEGHNGSTRQKILDIAIEYIRFLCENKGYFSVVVMNEKFLNPEQIREKSLISEGVRVIIDAYCREVNMTAEAKTRKTFIVRALILGAAEMMTADSLHYTEENIDMVRRCIDREFDIE